MRARPAYFVVALGLCLFAFAPLGYPGFIQSQAGFAPVYALYDWEAAGLSLGWHPGAAIAAWGPLRGDGLAPYAIAEAFRLVGLDGTTAIRVVLALAVALGATGALSLFATTAPPLAALAFALVWVYSPMSLSAVYVRGEAGAALALGLLPWLLLAAMPGREATAADRPTRPWPVVQRYLAPVLAGAAMGLSHFGFAALALLAAAALRPSRRWLPAVAGVALAGLWVVPQALRAGLLPSALPAPTLALPYQLLSGTFGYGASNLPWAADTPAPLGFGFVPLGLLVVAVAGARSAAPRRWLRPALVLTLLTVASTGAAAGLWHGGLLSALLAGPWQLLALAAFLLVATLAATLGPALTGRREAAAAALALLALVAAVPALTVPLTRVQPAAAPLASFDGGRILLLGAEVRGPLRHGATPRLRLYWQATEPLARDYTVFVHVVDDAGTKWGQRDSQPVDRARPTTSWRPGAVIEDDHRVYIDVNGPAQGYHLLLGLYDLETGERLLLENGDSALELPSG
ncbi:MAG: hypothetical protein ACYC5O_12225 [Anaerolineae bacterium]